MGNHNTRKAGIYIKELTNFVVWLYEDQSIMKNKNFILANATMNPGPSVSEYVKSIKKILKKEIFILSVPFVVLLTLSKILDLFLSVFKINHPFSPVRIKKLVNSIMLYLVMLEKIITLYYDLDSALEDWKKCPEEW